jgi:hypothetical protein
VVHLLLENQTAKRTKHVVLPVMLARVAVKLLVARKSKGKRGSPLMDFEFCKLKRQGVSASCLFYCYAAA